MGLVGFLKFALTCVDVLAWPLFALGYPLCASIRAIETHSNYHMRKLVRYWILFSLISLFELAFVKLIECVPIWPYIKLVAICWLVLPRFKGASYAYKSFIHPCLSVNLEEVISRFNKLQEASHKKENFLDVAERYVTENGTEALEKLIASKGARTNFDVEEIKSVAVPQKKEIPPTTDPEKKEIPSTTVPEIKEMPPTIKSNCKEFNFAPKDIKIVELTEKNAPAAANQVKCMESKLVQTEKETTAAVEVKETTVPTAGGEKSPSERVQKEWTCALCQVKTTCESNINSHLQGWKHKAKCEELKAAKVKAKATKQMEKNKAASSSSANKSAQANQDSKKSVSGDGFSQNKIKKQEEKVQVKANSEQHKQSGKKNSDFGTTHVKNRWCNMCCLTCKSETDWLSHLSGRRHLFRVEELANSYGRNWRCEMCDVTCSSAIDLTSHLSGRRHLSQVEELASSSGGVWV